MFNCSQYHVSEKGKKSPVLNWHVGWVGGKKL